MWGKKKPTDEFMDVKICSLYVLKGRAQEELQCCENT